MLCCLFSSLCDGSCVLLVDVISVVVACLLMEVLAPACCFGLCVSCLNDALCFWLFFCCSLSLFVVCMLFVCVVCSCVLFVCCFCVSFVFVRCLYVVCVVFVFLCCMCVVFVYC